MRYVVIFLLTLVVSCQKSIKKTQPLEKVVIAHRGASGYLPEHTLAAKAMAYAMHPDYIEQDVVLSKDDIPIVIHDIHLETVTNVAEVFPDRKREDGGFYVIDFTFEELKQLRVTERFDPKTGKAIYSNRFPKDKSTFSLHSLAEEIELIQGLNHSTGNDIGIYTEIKVPKFHHEEGKDISKIVLKTLAEYGYASKEDNCLLQCFDAKELERIRKGLKSELFLVQLFEFESNIEDIPHYATYTDALGPWYALLEDGRVMEFAKEFELPVHTFTIREDQLGDFVSLEKLLEKVFLEYQVDGVFTDQPDKVIAYLNP